MRLIFNTVDAPGATCDLGEKSAPTSVSLKMVDSSDQEFHTSAKNVVCENQGPDDLPTAKRLVFWKAPENCENGEVPTGRFSNGDITATVSIAGQLDFVEVLNIKCFAD